MKRCVFALWGILFPVWGGVMAQSDFALTEGVPALVYALPKTVLQVELELEKQVEKPGVFYLYSRRYLGVEEVVLAEKTRYTLQGVRVTPYAVPDPARRFSLVPEKSVDLPNITVNAQGILCGVNVPVVENKGLVSDRSVLPGTDASENPIPAVLPLMQEYMMAGSTAKLAEGAAKQIYDIRESRQRLLSGEMDVLPADGKALTVMLNGLDAQEQRLTALFVGTVRKETVTRRITVVPEKALDGEVLFRVSASRGLVDADDLGGAPYYIDLRPDSIRVEPLPDRAKPERTVLYTVLPARVRVTVGDGVDALWSQSLEMPQFGELTGLPESLFTSQDVQIQVDPASGRLLRVAR